MILAIKKKKLKQRILLKKLLLTILQKNIEIKVSERVKRV
jgi:hypothetical protein